MTRVTFLFIIKPSLQESIQILINYLSINELWFLGQVDVTQPVL